MKASRPFTAALFWLGVSLPLSSTGAEAGQAAVHFVDGYLTVTAQDARLGVLLDEIARSSGLTVVRHRALEQRVTVRFHRLSLEEGLRRILRHRSFVLEYARSAREKDTKTFSSQPKVLWILPQANDRVAGALVATEEAGPAKGPATLQIGLAGEDAEAREQAALGLGESGRTEAVIPLSHALADRSKEVRRAAVLSLAEIGGAQAAQALHIALADQDPRVREAAVDALGEIGGDFAVGLLELASRDTVKFVRQAAVEMLAELRGGSR